MLILVGWRGVRVSSVLVGCGLVGEATSWMSAVGCFGESEMVSGGCYRLGNERLTLRLELASYSNCRC